MHLCRLETSQDDTDDTPTNLYHGEVIPLRGTLAYVERSLYKIVTLEPKDTIGVQLSGCSSLKRSSVILSKIYSWWFLNPDRIFGLQSDIDTRILSSLYAMCSCFCFNQN